MKKKDYLVNIFDTSIYFKIDLYKEFWILGEYSSPFYVIIKMVKI